MKKGTTKVILCFVLIIIIVVFLLVIKHYKKPNEVDVKTSALRLEETTNFNNELKVNLEPFLRESEYDICNNEYNYCDKEYLSIKTENEESYLLENYRYKYFFYVDGEKIKMFNAEENKSYSIDNIKSNYNVTFVIDNNGNFIGVVYSTDINDHSNYLLIEGNKVLYKGKYDYIVSISPKYLSANRYDKDGHQIGAYIINAQNEEEPLISKEYITEEYYGFFDLGNKYIIFEYGNEFELYDNNTLKVIYKSNKLNLMSGDGYPRFLYGIDSNNNIYIYDDKYLSILDKKGKETKKSKEEIYGIDLIDKYVINKQNNELTITDIDNNKIKIASLINGDVDYYEYIEKDNKKGIIFDVYDKTLSFEEAYNSCKETKCKGVTLDEFKKDYKNFLGYEYFFDYNTSKVTKTPTVIIPTNKTD